MIRYSPPKSSIWGHSMWRKRPAEFRDCVIAFLKEVAGEYKTGSCNLRPPSVSKYSDDVRAFVESYNVEVRIFPDPHLPRIAEADFLRCLDWVASYPKKIPFQSVDFSLSRCFYISSWNSGMGNKTNLNSELVEDYGSIQMLGTRLEFETVDEYHCVKAAMKRIFRLELNDKHVRPKGAVG